MERVISVSLSEWIIRLQLHDSTYWTALCMLGLFLLLYGATKWMTSRQEHTRLERLSKSLELQSAAQSSLVQTVHSEAARSSAEEQLLLDRLLGCQAAAYINPDTLAQISAYADDRDTARLPLLLRTLEREVDRLCEERDTLLSRMENPSWGYALWKQVRYILPFIFASLLFILFIQLLQLLSGGTDAAVHGYEELLVKSTQWGSALFSLLLLYPILIGGTRPTASSLLQRIWSLFISALYLLHLISPAFSPYILLIQIVLFGVGFRLTASKPRKSRPFAGLEQTSDSLPQELPEQESDV